MCKHGECLECTTIDRNQKSDYLDNIARFLISSGNVKTDDMKQEEISEYVINVVTFLRAELTDAKTRAKTAEANWHANEARNAKLVEAIKAAQIQLHATQRNWDEDCLFRCNDIMKAALKGSA